MIAMRNGPPDHQGRLLIAALSVLGLYTVALFAVEATTSQEYVRHFVTDITGEVPFYAVNTTLSVSFLWGTTLLLVVAANLPSRLIGDTGRWWMWSQAAVFFYLGCDDRFGLHELLSRRLRLGDHYILLGVALVEMGLLAYGWRRNWIPATARSCLKSAALLFAVMWMIDGFAPHDLVMRLSTEDLCKTWSCFFFARFAWVMLFSHLIERTEPSREDTEWQEVFRSRKTAELAEVTG